MDSGKIGNRELKTNFQKDTYYKDNQNSNAERKNVLFNELLSVKINSSKEIFGNINENLQPVQKNKLTFSAHASKRIEERNIDLSETDRESLETLVQLVREKGGKDALVMMKKAGFLVSIKNNKVITVLDSQQLKSNVITNIDSAVIA
jgi:flagellar operon protein